MWDDLVCGQCDGPLEPFEWVRAGVAHEDAYCVDNPRPPWAPGEPSCVRCVVAQALPRCPDCHLTWPDGTLIEQDTVLVFTEVTS